MPNFQPYGDTAILINFEQKINIAINGQISFLNKKITEKFSEWIQFCIPAYCSLTVGFDWEKVTYEEAVLKIQTLISNLKNDFESPVLEKKETRILNIPICYDAKFALDLKTLSQQKQLSPKEIINYHSSKTYHIFMLGFLPGFPYLGILPNEIACQRKANPHPKVPARSVGMAGLQTGIYPSDAPGGWQIIGKTPVDIFSPQNENPFLFQVGDQVNFYKISYSAFQKIEQDISKQTFNWKEIYG